jgi:hypothetical protein
MKFAITESITLKEVYKKLRSAGIQDIDKKRLKFSLNEGGYGACVLIEYQEDEPKEEDWY